MLTSSPKGREFQAITLNGEITRTIYLLKVGGAMISELSPQVLQSEALYEEFRNDRVSSISAMAAMAQRVAREHDISVSKAIELISSRPQQKQLAAGGEPQVTVMGPDDKEPEANPLAYVSDVEHIREKEIRGLFGIDSENSSATKGAMLEYQKIVTTHVLRARLARTVEVADATPVNGDRLYIPTGAFFEIKAGDRLKFGDVIATVVNADDSQELIVEPVAKPVQGIGFLLSPETDQEIIGFPWTDIYTEQLLESHLQAIYDFWVRERLAVPHDEPELEHLAERYEVFDSPEDESGNAIAPLSKEQAQPELTGEISEKKSESTATAATK
jgi:hypothetical protein